MAGMLPTTASAWWTCPSGYEFNIKDGKKVQCYKPAKTSTHKLKSCPKVKVLGTWVGSFYKQDYFKGRTDACTSKDPTGTFTTAVPHAFCKAGYTHKKIKGKKDKCVKHQKSKTIPPKVKTS